MFYLNHMGYKGLIGLCPKCRLYSFYLNHMGYKDLLMDEKERGVMRFI